MPVDEIKFRISWAWSWVLTDAVSHRKDFEGIHLVDVGLTKFLLDKYGESDRIFLRCNLDGTMVTQKDRGHWEQDNDGTCPYCGQPDGYAHRAWDCPWFSDCRSDIADADLRHIAQMPQCVTQHAWAVKLPSQLRLLQALADIPIFDPSQYALNVAPWPVYDLFTRWIMCFSERLCPATCRMGCVYGPTMDEPLWESSGSSRTCARYPSNSLQGWAGGVGSCVANSPATWVIGSHLDRLQGGRWFGPRFSGQSGRFQNQRFACRFVAGGTQSFGHTWEQSQFSSGFFAQCCGRGSVRSW